MPNCVASACWLALSVGSFGCASTTGPARVELSELCDSPDRYDAQMIRVELDLSPDSVQLAASSAAMCNADDPCCNSGFFVHRQICPGNTRELLVLPEELMAPPGEPLLCHGQAEGGVEATCPTPTCADSGPTVVEGVFTASDPAWEGIATLRSGGAPMP